VPTIGTLSVEALALVLLLVLVSACARRQSRAHRSFWSQPARGAKAAPIARSRPKRHSPETFPATALALIANRSRDHPPASSGWHPEHPRRQRLWSVAELEPGDRYAVKVLSDFTGLAFFQPAGFLVRPCDHNHFVGRELSEGVFYREQRIGVARR
jgi:hypothetical protein